MSSVAPLRVLYDLSPLGMTVRRPALYAGISRVVDHVARGLAVRADVVLTLYGAEQLPECERFAQSQTELRGCAFVRSPRLPRLNEALWRLPQFVENTVASRAFPHRAARWLAVRGGHALRHRQAKLKVSNLVSNFDLYHSPKHPIPESVLKARSLPKFLTVYDLIPRLFPNFLTANLANEYERIFRSITPEIYCLCISEHTKQDLLAHCSAEPSRCFVTPLAASESFYPCEDNAQIEAVKQKYSIPPGRYLLSLSTLEPRKNFPLVIRAFLKTLEESGDDELYMVLVGNKGWKYDSILAEAQRGALDRHRVIFTGYVDEEDLAAVYSGASAFVYMSRYEGFGLPPLEAMQCGVPVITSNNTSLPEVVGNSGIMLDVNDEEGLAGAMLELCQSSERRYELRTLALRRAKQFTWAKCVDQTVAAYREALTR